MRLVVAFPPGGGTDAAARLLAGPMGRALATNVVVENRAGAAGTLAGGEVARAAPDGTTLLFDASSHLLVPFVMRAAPEGYQTAFTPITKVVVYPQMLVVRAASPYRTLAELLAEARRRPDALTFALPGNGTLQQLAGTMLFGRAGVSLLNVAYRGSAAAVQSVVAGETDCVINLSASLPLVRDGLLRALAVTSAERMRLLPDVPTIAELGFDGFDMSDWSGIWGPAGLPPATATRLADAARQALESSELRDRLTAGGGIPVGNAPADFAAEIDRQRRDLAAAAATARITME
jgi:tripartite-type tricarboxylate transporter receptor subunit TctC